MTTAFATGPGFYAAKTTKSDPSVPPGQMRFFLARLEAYDGPIKADALTNQTEFSILAAMCVGKPTIARALLELSDHIQANRAMISAEASKE